MYLWTNSILIHTHIHSYVFNSDLHHRNVIKSIQNTDCDTQLIILSGETNLQSRKCPFPVFNLQFQLNGCCQVIWPRGAERMERFALKELIYGFLFKPSRNLNGVCNCLLREQQRQRGREQIGETGLIRPQSYNQTPQLIPRKCQESHGG